MRNVLKVLSLSMLLLSGHVTWATPQADARFIAERELDAFWTSKIEDALRSYFVAVYFKPISGRGVVIADEEAFRRLIPAEDIAPYLDDLVTRIAPTYLAVLNPEQLATMAAILRADKEATVAKILSNAEDRKFAVALEQARAKKNKSQSNDPTIAHLEELTVQMEAFSLMIEDGGAELIGQSLALGLAPLRAMDVYHRSIMKIEKPAQNPVTLAAIKTNGVLRFANPVQRQGLIRKLSKSEGTGNIRFIRPPVSKTNH